MQPLFELPPVVAKEQIKKRQAGIPDISQLKRGQLETFNGVMDCLRGNDGGFVVLAGYAGCGKSYVVARIIEQYLSEFGMHRVAFAATTNKATKVAYRTTEYKHPGLDFSTIHKLLALKESIQKDGTIDFFPDKWATSSISEYNVVFIDESSMLNKRLFGYLLDHVDRVKIIFVGDDAQIVPVKEIESIVFSPRTQRDHSMVTFKLTEIIRQAADNPIINVTTWLRNNLTTYSSLKAHFKYSDQLYDTDKGVKFINRSDRNERAYFDELLRHIFTSSNFQHSADFGKVLAYTNKTVNALNRGIRRMIYNTHKLRRIEENEKLVTKAPVFDSSLDRILINNAEELIVQSFERRVETINNGLYQIPYYEAKVLFYDIVGMERTELINIPTDIGVKALNQVLDILSNAAKTYKPGSFAASSAWADFYSLKKQFAEISYNYALTFHLSQGSTFSNVLVLESDAQICNRVVEKNKLVYTGCTRPSDRLWIL